jgi:hypothetical protein
MLRMLIWVKARLTSPEEKVKVYFDHNEKRRKEVWGQDSYFANKYNYS